MFATAPSWRHVAGLEFPAFSEQALSELDQLRSFDRINLSSTFFQATIVLAFAAAHLGATRQFRRPALRALAVFWALFAVAAVVNIFSSWAGAIWQQRALSRALTTIVVALSASAIPYAVGAARAMSTAVSPPPSVRHATYWGLAVLVLHAAGVFGLGAAYPDQRIFAVEWSRTLAFGVSVVPAWMCWQERRHHAADSTATRLLAMGLTALALRQGLSLGLGLRVGLPDLPEAAQLVALSGEVVTIMAMGALSLLATTAEELRYEQQQGATLREALTRLAAGERMESLGRLASGVSHDFNNVLQVVVFASATIKGRTHDPADVSALEEVDKAVGHGRALVRQLLDFARPPERVAATCDTGKQLDGITALLRTLLSSGIELQVRTPERPAMVHVEPTAFEQVVINLVANARDATPVGGRVAIGLEHVSIRALRDAVSDIPDGEYVKLSVADTGEGIAPEAAAHIFEPFFTTKPSERGTGLGLATVHGIVHGCGGGVTVRSAPGAGTTFDVYFPAA